MTEERWPTEFRDASYLRKATKALRDASGTSLVEAREALLDMDFDEERALRHLRRWPRWAPEVREAETNVLIHNTESFKRWLWIIHEEGLAEADRWIEDLEEDLENQG